jgi:RimJ/RimL family protein N-acetyltransferase
VLIRPYELTDWADVWALLKPVFRSGETYAYSTSISESEAKQAWTGGTKGVFVAADSTSGQIVGTYYLKENHAGPGDHVCNCGYVVSTSAQGRGVATLMCKHSLAEARSRGFRAMQFNLVVASNERAVRLWKRMGFDIVGTLPEAFRHPTRGFVEAYVMYRSLR